MPAERKLAEPVGRATAPEVDAGNELKPAEPWVLAPLVVMSPSRCRSAICVEHAGKQKGQESKIRE